MVIKILKIISFCIMLFFILFILGIIKFKNNIPVTSTILNNNYDAIVVLTGGKGERIQNARNLYNEKNISKMFISGVAHHFGSEKIFTQSFKFNDNDMNCCIDIGNLSTNTYENALETKFWAENQNVNSIILVTSDLHMQRASFIFKKLTQLKLITYPIKTELEYIPLEKLILEYLKFIIYKIIFVGDIYEV